jgi:hypothetical protein
LRDPARIAAVVIAAECWAVDDDEPEGRLSNALETSRVAFKAAEDAEYQARAAAHRRSAPRPTTLSFNERRAAELEGAKPRPGDFPGRKGAGAHE